MSRKDLLNGECPVSFEQALYKAAHDMRGGVVALSALMGDSSNYNTLNHKLNIYNKTHHLKPDEVEQILRITEDPIIVESLARMIDLVVFKPEPMAVDNQALVATGKVLKDMGRFIDSLATGGEDDVWEQHEVATLEEHGNALIKRLLGVLAGARAAYEKDDK